MQFLKSLIPSRLKDFIHEKTKLFPAERLFDIIVKILASICEAIVVFIVFNVLNQQFFLRSIGLSYLAAAATVGILASARFEQETNLKRKADRIVLVGLISCLALSLLSNRFRGFINIIIELPILMFVYYRATKKFQANDLYAYTILDFYAQIAIILSANFMVYWLKGFFLFEALETISPLVSLYTVTYIGLGIVLLVLVKNRRFAKQRKSSKLSFEMFLSAGILLSTFILSAPNIMMAILNTLKALTRGSYAAFVKLTMLIIDLIIYIIELFYGKGIEHMKEREDKSKRDNPAKPPPNEAGIDEPPVNSEYDMEPPDINNWRNIIITAIILVVVLVIIYLIYLGVRRAYKKSLSGSNFVEDREFVSPAGLSKLSDFLNKMKNRIGQAFRRLRLNVNADNKEKLRFEYKLFLQRLHDKFIIPEENHTPRDVMLMLQKNYPEHNESFETINTMYEQVRYGEQLPTNEELQAFKTVVSKVVMAIFKDPTQ